MSNFFDDMFGDVLGLGTTNEKDVDDELLRADINFLADKMAMVLPSAKIIEIRNSVDKMLEDDVVSFAMVDAKGGGATLDENGEPLVKKASELNYIEKLEAKIKLVNKKLKEEGLDKYHVEK